MSPVSLAIGAELRLQIDKPAAGGWMIARENGQVVLVSGAIPGETVRARVERTSRGVTFARVVDVSEPSADRREAFTDPQCGGCLYAHIAYPRQLAIKSQVIADALTRIGRLALPTPIEVAGSPPDGYRMRARLHVRGGRIGFFREGTHEICEARPTRQLLPETCEVLDRAAALLRSLGADLLREVELSENVPADARVLQLEAAGPLDPRPLITLSSTAGITGVTLGSQIVCGDPHVSDRLEIDGRTIALRRHVRSFFQGNRFLLAALVERVLKYVPRGAEVVDLYAGVGLFSIAAAVARDAHVHAVEGDRTAATDLAFNAAALGGAVETIPRPVESYVRASDRAADVLVIDPPRTGMSREALDGALALTARIVVYVSCDVATLARDVRRFSEAGYRLAAVEAFDLFPNTPHVETVVKLERTSDSP